MATVKKALKSFEKHELTITALIDIYEESDDSDKAASDLLEELADYFDDEE